MNVIFLILMLMTNFNANDKYCIWTWGGKQHFGIGLRLPAIPKLEIEFGGRRPLNKEDFSIITSRANIVLFDRFGMGVHTACARVYNAETIGIGFQFSNQRFILRSESSPEDLQEMVSVGLLSSINDASELRIRRTQGRKN